MAALERAAASPGRGAVAGGAALLLLGHLSAVRACPGSVAGLQGQSLARTLRAAATQQVAGLLLLAAALPPPAWTRGYPDHGDIIPGLGALGGSSFSHLVPLPPSAVVLGAVAYALLLSSLVTAHAHRRAWVPSLPDCRRPGSLPCWLLVAADTAGALAGTLLASTSVVALDVGLVEATDEAHIAAASRVYIAAASGLVLCVASACFGA